MGPHTKSQDEVESLLISNSMRISPQQNGTIGNDVMKNGHANNPADMKGDESLVPEPERGTNMYMLGCSFSMIASCLRAFSMAGSQMLDDIVGEFQLNVGRFGSMLFFLMPYLLIKRPSLLIAKKSILPVLFLSLITFGCNIFIYASTVYIPVGTANTVINVSFLSIVMLMYIVNIFCGGALWNVKSLTADILAVVFTCVGVAFVIQPEFLFAKVPFLKPEKENYSSFCNPHRFDSEMVNSSLKSESVVDIYKHESWKGYVHALLAGLFNALRIMFNKSVLRHEDIYPVMFWTALIATVLSLITTVIFEDFILPASIICTLIVFGHASATGLQTVLLVAGMKHVPSTDVTLIYSFSVALLFLFQFTFLKYASPAPDNSVAVGAAILVSCISIGKPLIEVYFVRCSKKESK